MHIFVYNSTYNTYAKTPPRVPVVPLMAARAEEIFFPAQSVGINPTYGVRYLYYCMVLCVRSADDV